MKNSEIKITISSLESISTPIPVKTSFTIAKNLRTLKEALEIYNEEHDKLIKKYAADGSQIRPSDDVKSFAAELAELNDLDAGITLEKIKYADIEDLALNVPQTSAILYMTEV